MGGEKIREIISDSIMINEKLHSHAEEILKSAEIMIYSLKNGNKIISCGNGGSASQAQHFSAELVGRFEKERKALPSIAITTDTSNLTALGNDYGYDIVFKRQIESLGGEGDILVCFTSSGNSQNLIEAINEAKKKKMKIINLLGKGGGKMKGTGDIEIIVQSDNTARIQECHLLILHIFAKLIEDSFTN
ncbi:MAG TPA: SIS domain-containing protein [Candidatus Nanoarchaeia archaeon]|nr:SIS domain-containing protein [Candidatus Nanoarchaeia archaeon]